MMHTFGFVLGIEPGDLELKTALLVESIRRIPSLSGCPIYAVQPRQGPQPKTDTLRLLADNQVRFLYEPELNRKWWRHGPMNKVYASAVVEPLVEQIVETLVFLDSDVLAVRPLDGLVLPDGVAAAVAPVAEWAVGRMGQLVGEPLTPYWQMIFDTCGVLSLPDWRVVSTIDQRAMLPYFNAGVVAVRPALGVFRRWRDNVERLYENEAARSLPLDSREFFFLDQTTLAGTLLAFHSQDVIRVLHHRYNYPLHAHHHLPEGVRARRLEDISLVHYHGHFSNLYWLDDLEVSDELAAWLLERLPLRPKFKPTRSSVAMLAAHYLSRFPLRRHHHRLVTRLPGLRKTVPYSGKNV